MKYSAYSLLVAAIAAGEVELEMQEDSPIEDEPELQDDLVVTQEPMVQANVTTGQGSEFDFFLNQALGVYEHEFSCT